MDQAYPRWGRVLNMDPMRSVRRLTSVS